MDSPVEAELTLPAGEDGGSAAAWMLAMTSKFWRMSSISGISSSSSSSSKVSSNCSLGKDGEAKRLANAIMPAFGSPGVLRSGDGGLAALPIALVVMVLVLSAEAGEEKIELPSVNARLDR